ncbi:hypothetical protein L1987_35527 [Smallanthus sonchifolius]|uniref:Uncharacterized protein n=1 Tax=Smallanthus sonchifolius TaxID=185202 RepID=A0ACB9HYB9_9ASTR|nr:hypothetical protein L1987_35527 [Smallanthus sonchifolius]
MNSGLSPAWQPVSGCMLLQLPSFDRFFSTTPAEKGLQERGRIGCFSFNRSFSTPPSEKGIQGFLLRFGFSPTKWADLQFRCYKGCYC